MNGKGGEMVKVLVTGISGFVASHVTLRLLEAGFDVRGSLRDLAKGEAVKARLGAAGGDMSRVEFVALDLSHDDGWEDAMLGVDLLCHCASPFVVHIPDNPQDIIGPAVAGTQRALNAALKAGVKRIAMTSSYVAAAFGTLPKGRPYTETDWSEPGGYGMTPYNDSKVLAERTAWSIMEAAGRRDDLSAINPALILGPALDKDLSPSFLLIKRLMQGEFPIAPKFALPVADVRDVAALHVKALQGGLGGRRCLVGAETYSIIQLARAIAAEDPDRKKLPAKEAPNWLIRAFGIMDKSVKTISPELGFRRDIDASAAEAALGRKLISSEEATRAAARSLIEIGVV